MVKPAVSVLIDTYNHERYIEEAIVSVLEQDYPSEEVEVIVVDDGSTDRTPDIIQKFQPRVRYLRKANGGQASAFNAGIPETRGEIVAFLDGDDWWAKNKLSRAVGVLDEHLEIGFVGHGNILVYPDGRRLQESLREDFRFQANTIEGARLFRVRKSFLGTCRMVIRREVIQKIGKVPEELRFQADEYLFTLAAVLCQVEVLPDPLLYYRLHGANMFMVDRHHAEGMRRKHAMLEFLAMELLKELPSRGVGKEVCKTIVEIIQAEADQVRLMMGDGHPWETVGTEWKLYSVISAGVPLGQRLWKAVTLAPAAVLPPGTYYAWRNRVARNSWYRNKRDKYLPKATQRHVEAAWSSKA